VAEDIIISKGQKPPQGDFNPVSPETLFSCFLLNFHYVASIAPNRESREKFFPETGSTFSGCG
jgi:hypothetical protein